jgi:hypothetical protein
MVEWILVLTLITPYGQGTGGAAVAPVRGFTTQAFCVAAGTEWANKVRTAAPKTVGTAVWSCHAVGAPR